MKRTLEELKQFQDGDHDELNYLKNQKAFENLKNTLSSSELSKPLNYSSIQTNLNNQALPRGEKRSSSLLPRTEEIGRGLSQLPESGKLYQSLEPDHSPQFQYHKQMQQNNLRENLPYNMNIENRAAADDPKIHFEDYSKPQNIKQADQGPLPDQGLPKPVPEGVANQIEPSFGEDQLRPTSDFHQPLEHDKDDSQEAASSYNPFRRQLINKDAISRNEEASDDSAPSKYKSKKDNDLLLKSLKDKIPGGKLKDEDLERIERIFRNKRYDPRVLDLEDSDIDYF